MARTKSILEISQAAATECIAFAIRKAARTVTQRYDDALAPVGLRNTQFTLLNAIHLLDSPTINRLAQALATDRTTLTRNLRLLEKAELLRSRAGEDRRTREVELTRRGHALLERALPIWRRTNRAVADDLGAELAESLIGDLDRLTHRLRDG